MTERDAKYLAMLGYSEDAARLLTSDQDAPVDPAVVGSPFPGRPGYITGTCGHAVAGSEWRVGFRECERCPS